MNSKLKIFTITLISIVLFLFAVLAIRNFPFQDQFRIDMILGQDTSIISSLGPPVRVITEPGFERILETPVYFNVRTMPWYNRAEVYVTYKEDNLIFDGIGGQTALGFNYHLQPSVVIRGLSDDWQKAVFTFDLDDVFEVNNFRRFIISSSGQIEGQKGELRIKKLTVILFK